MDHFRLEDWADFSRGLTPEELTGRMRDHLSRECDGCRHASAFIEEVAEFLPRESSTHIPPNDVRRAKALAVGARKSAGPVGSALELLASLVFDSRMEPAQAGIRGTAIRGRHLVYTSGDYRIEVRIEDDEITGTSGILGQVFHEDSGAADVIVLLSSADGVRGSALTNSVGEFEFEAAGPALEMRVVPYGSILPLVIKLADIDSIGEART